MNHYFMLALAGAAGAVLGLLFFGGLWWTLRRAFISSRPALWVGGSLVVRMALTASGFVFVSNGDWRRSLACLLGFWLARWAVVRLTTRLPHQLHASTSAGPARRTSSKKSAGQA